MQDLINLYQYNNNLMGSPTKQKLRDSVQHEMLTNYYLNKYQKAMSKLTDKRVQTVFQQRKPRVNDENSSKRRNFKQFILQRKAQRNNITRNQNSGIKNFKQELGYKNSKQKIQKQNRKNFYKLQDTIAFQLYQPSPSKLEKGKYQEIQVVHKVSYQDKADKVQLFKLIKNENQINLQINQSDKQQLHQVSFVELPHSQISKAIKSTFQKRSPKKNKSSSVSPNRRQSASINQKQKSLSKSPNNKFPPKINSNNVSNQSSQFFQAIKNNINTENFQQLPQINFDEKSQKLQVQRKNSINSSNHYNNINHDDFLFDDKKSNASFISKSKQKTAQNVVFQSGRVERKNSLAKSVKNDKKLNSSYHEDSFHLNIPQIQQQPKISPKANKLQQRQKSSSQHHSSVKQQSKSLKSSYIHNQSVHKDSVMHEFSMMSRFSMTSDEGHLIRQQLMRQLNENQFGPYQNALTNFLDLIQDHPHAWPIFVVGQRILNDRHQYQKKREAQQNQLSRLQAGIQNLKRAKNKRTEIQQNSLTILGLVRKLAGLLQEQKN